MRRLFCSTFFLLLIHIVYAQHTTKIDSILNQKAAYTKVVADLQQNFTKAVLENTLENESNEKYKVKLLHALCWKYFNTQPQKALNYANLQIQAAEKAQNKAAMAMGYSDMGNLYNNLSEYQKSITSHLKALKISEEEKDTATIVICLTGIGSVYFSMGNYTQALQYMIKTGKLDSMRNTKDNLVADYANVGICYSNINQHAKALQYLLKSESVCKEIGQTPPSVNLLNTGIAYQKNHNLTKALFYLQQALLAAQKENDVSTVASVNIALGDFFVQIQDYRNATKYAQKALLLAMDNKLTNEEIQALKTLADVSAKTGNYQQAFSYQQKFADLKDTLLTEKNARAITEMNTKYETEKKEKQLQIQDLTLNQNKLELKKRQIIIYSTAAGIVLLLLLSFFILRGYREKKKANIELTQKNEIIEEKSKIVEEQHKDIIDSINYAKRIQQAILSEEEHISEHLPPHFIFFQPKDIVSGDFYWALEKGDYLYVAAADCTGHGVPGAFLTMLGISYLNELNSQEEIFTPAEILNLLRDKIVKELSKHGTTKDGMDISLMRMNLKTNEIMWAGAFNPLWYTENGILQEIKANKQPIGYAEDIRPFTNHTLPNLRKDDSLYLFTDGLADQFGGSKGKKYKYKQLEEVLMSNRLKPFEEQKSLLKKSFDDWKGGLEQVDDVTIIAIQVA